MKKNILITLVFFSVFSASAQDHDYLTPTNDPKTHLWGIHAMDFPEAWNITRGNAYVAIVDTIGWQDVVDRNEFSGVRRQFSDVGSQLESTARSHGTHVAGTVGADGGIVGGCPGCSLILQYTNIEPFTDSSVSMNANVRAIEESTRAGAQVINYSTTHFIVSDSVRTDSQVENRVAELELLRAAINSAVQRDILVVASAGNYGRVNVYDGVRLRNPGMPAFWPNVLAVGAVARDDTSPLSWTKWDFNVIPADSTSQPVLEGGVMAPGADILSGYIVNTTYFPGKGFSDEEGIDLFRPGDGVGLMSGTSMAAPHVSAVAGLVRSINPLLNVREVKEILRRSSDLYSASANELSELDSTFYTFDSRHSDNCTIDWKVMKYCIKNYNVVGSGMVNAERAVHAALSTNPSRLTPLFSMYSASRGDHFYTIVPQMALSAIKGELLPHVQSGTAYSPIGANIFHGASPHGYFRFPGGSLSDRPRAEVWVFTTDENPMGPERLAPLYRLSWKCGDGRRESVCEDSPLNTNTAYVTSSDEVLTYRFNGFKLDGIEGYVYPISSPQPDGTVMLLRGYNAERDDYAIFPEGRMGEMQDAGYMTEFATDLLGYVYENDGVRKPTYSVVRTRHIGVVPASPPSHIVRDYETTGSPGVLRNVVAFEWVRVEGASRYEITLSIRPGHNVQGTWGTVTVSDSQRCSGNVCSVQVNLHNLVSSHGVLDERPLLWGVRAEVRGVWHPRLFNNELSIRKLN